MMLVSRKYIQDLFDETHGVWARRCQIPADTDHDKQLVQFASTHCGHPLGLAPERRQ